MSPKMDPLDERVKRLRRQETAEEFDTQDKIKLLHAIVPEGEKGIPFYKDWLFWLVIGGVVAACVLSNL